MCVFCSCVLRRTRRFEVIQFSLLLFFCFFLFYFFFLRVNQLTDVYCFPRIPTPYKYLRGGGVGFVAEIKGSNARSDNFN